MFSRVVDVIESVLKVIVAILCIILLFTLFIQVLNRYIFGVSWPILQFIIPFCFLWMCMLGGALAVRRSQHFEVDILSKFLKGRVRHAHKVIIIVCVLFAGVMIAWGGVAFMHLGLLKKNSATGINMIYIYSSLFFAGILIMIMAIDRLINVKHLNREQK